MEAAQEKKGNVIWEGIKYFFHLDIVTYTIKRLLMFIPTMLLVSLIVFFVIQLPPGDCVTNYIAKMQNEGEQVSQATIDQMKEEYALDKPFIVRYFSWIKGIIWTSSNSSWYRLYGTHHNWKFSFTYSKTVWSVIQSRLGLTVALTGAVLLFQYIISFPIAVYSATHQYSVGDYIFSFIGFIGAAVPSFILAILCMYISYKWLGNAYVGLFTDEMKVNGIHWYNLGEFLKRLIIPFIVLGLGGTCTTIRTVRAQMLDEVLQQYTITARAKGVKESTIIWKYCFRAALNPTITGLGGVLSQLFSGSTVSALVLNIAIIGPLLYEALQNQDMYLAGAIVMVQAFLVTVGVLLTDIGLAFLDPRIRYSGGSK